MFVALPVEKNSVIKVGTDSMGILSVAFDLKNLINFFSSVFTLLNLVDSPIRPHKDAMFRVYYFIQMLIRFDTVG